MSDYRKSVCTRSPLEVLSNRTRADRVPILVDLARDRSWSDYGQVTLIKANLIEALDVATEETRLLAMGRCR